MKRTEAREKEKKVSKETLLRYREAVSFVESFTNASLRFNFGQGKKDPAFYLDRMEDFLHLIGSPHKGFKYVHVTGTAGKGTVTNMVHNIFMLSGKVSGLFTSPHVTTAIEKIKVGDRYISPEDFVRLVDKLRPAIEKAKKAKFGNPSFFELFFAIALLYFKERGCEWVVLEVGLGGRYDATNVIEHPRITAITNIDYDHTELLGKTLKKIAWDKAGIIKRGSVFVTTETRPHILAIFEEICRKQGASFRVLPKKLGYRQRNKDLVYAIAKECGIEDACIQEGIEATRLPCRFEKIAENPLVILDGAHNRAKMETTISNIGTLSFGKLILVFAIAHTNKDSVKVVKRIVPVADKVIIAGTNGADRKSIHPQMLLPLVRKYKKARTPVDVIETPQEAIEKALKDAAPEDCILVTGSFFLAGEIRKKWYPEKWVLEKRRSFR